MCFKSQCSLLSFWRGFCLAPSQSVCHWVSLQVAGTAWNFRSCRHRGVILERNSRSCLFSFKTNMLPPWFLEHSSSINLCSVGWCTHCPPWSKLIPRCLFLEHTTWVSSVSTWPRLGNSLCHSFGLFGVALNIDLFSFGVACFIFYIQTKEQPLREKPKHRFHPP